MLTRKRSLIAEQSDQTLDKSFCRPVFENDISITQTWLQENQSCGVNGLQEIAEPGTL
jgi:hypothetical protein